MREAVRRIYRERKALTASLKVSTFSLSGAESLTEVTSGRGLCYRKTRCCHGHSFPPHFHLRMPAHLQSQQYPRIARPTCYYHPWFLLHFWTLCANAFRIGEVHLYMTALSYYSRGVQLIFIFSTHVFDVGDLVMIDDSVSFCETRFPLSLTCSRSLCSSESSDCFQQRLGVWMAPK